MDRIIAVSTHCFGEVTYLMRVWTPRSMGPAETRLARGAAAFTGMGALFYLIVLLPSLRGQAWITADWWTPAAMVLIFGTALIVLAAAIVGNPRLLFLSIHLFAVGYLTAIVFWFPAWNGSQIDAAPQNWLTAAPGLIGIALAAVWTWPACIAAVAVALPLSRIISAASEVTLGAPLLADALHATFFSALFTAAVCALMRTGRTLDATADEARRQAISTASAVAIRMERRRFDALVHDGVLATLLAVHKGGPGAVDATVAAQANATLVELRELSLGTTHEQMVASFEAVARIKAAIGTVDEFHSIDARVESESISSVPESVVTALVAGSLEAVRNVARHANPARAAVAIVCDRSGITVRVADEGPGFAPDRVAPNRLGLRASIHGRFADLDNGWSEVDSAPGRGTTVTMGWAAQ